MEVIFSQNRLDFLLLFFGHIRWVIIENFDPVFLGNVVAL